MKNKINSSFVWLPLLLITFSFAKPAEAQTDSLKVTQEIQFIDYLVASQQNTEALYLINRYINTSAFKIKADSMHFLKGKALYNQQLLHESSNAFSKVSPKFTNYLPAKLLQAYEYTHIGDSKKSEQILDSLECSDPLISELIKFEKASIYILNSNMDAFNKYQTIQDTSFNQLYDAQLKLNDYAFRIQHHKTKSPLIAGLMSAVIPGSGKMYTGKIGEGISTLLGMSVLGAITYENYSKVGISNYKTILFGSLFTVLYAGNIFGSVYSVKVYRNEFNESISHAVVFNMHIPIRTVFPHIF
ncbi:MAG: hypothetical protein PF517_15960 [Salinivirgaceae bacterium]|nr:hypothetical protein [Salinivirgaceae bacterium]